MCNHKKLSSLNVGDRFSMAWWTHQSNTDGGHACMCPVMVPEASDAVEFECIKKYPGGIIAKRISTGKEFNYGDHCCMLNDTDIAKSAMNMNIVKESPCPRPACGKMNDKGMKKCWWCEGSLSV